MSTMKFCREWYQQHPVPKGGQGQAHPLLCMSQLRAPGTTHQPLSLLHQQIQSNLLAMLLGPSSKLQMNALILLECFEKILNPLLFYHLQATARGEEGMTLFFVCCSPDCGHRWRE
ncbi:hypothetical protein BAE44_0023363 [Dichanthelium oligosanthes]|uniref:TFIIS-type domain-containing protein n=1 Tax=Dichanthelium oligosanthes TaxID=888268 RepID=A0A1E5URX3_9POAL|nr:hypothetical protein BAE44_0023363 [Dichanthelium oligosanthes]